MKSLKAVTIAPREFERFYDRLNQLLKEITEINNAVISVSYAMTTVNSKIYHGAVIVYQ